MPPFESLTYDSLHPGPRLIVLGAVHGNETCGTKAIETVCREMDEGTVELVAGRVTFVPRANPLAYANGTRNGERNLNRRLAPVAEIAEYEDRIANRLCPLLADHDLLLDLHSFQGQGEAFVMLGPPDNEAELEPFSQSATEEAWARRLGVRRAVDGWLSTYALGVAQRKALARNAPGVRLDLDPKFGVGTTEFMRSAGGAALTLECGSHSDPQSVEVALKAIRNSLAHFGLVNAPTVEPSESMECLRLYTVETRLDAGDRFAREWKSFDAVRAAEVIGVRADGTEVLANDSGWVVFPNDAAAPGQEWFYLAKEVKRL